MTKEGNIKYEFKKIYNYRDEDMDMNIEIWINDTDIINGKIGNMIMIILQENSELVIKYNFIYYMVYYGIYEMVKWLVEYGEPISKIGTVCFDQYIHNPYEFKGKSPLHISVKYNHFAIVKYLVENNADINLEDEKQMTPLEYAKTNVINSINITKYLIGKGAKH